MLAKIEGEDCPELKEKTEGGEAIDQVFRVCSWNRCTLADALQDGIPQLSGSNMSHVWKRGQLGVPHQMADSFNRVHRSEALL